MSMITRKVTKIITAFKRLKLNLPLQVPVIIYLDQTTFGLLKWSSEIWNNLGKVLEAKLQKLLSHEALLRSMEKHVLLLK